MATAQHRVTASARIGAAPRLVYDIVADYRTGHPRILPLHFSDLSVERGGVGAGTVIRFRLRVLGRTQGLRAAITEPEPGHVLVETNLEGQLAVTTFTVDPADGGLSCDVTISTDIVVRTGILGVVERGLMTRLLKPIYERELELLAACAVSPAAHT